MVAASDSSETANRAFGVTRKTMGGSARTKVCTELQGDARHVPRYSLLGIGLAEPFLCCLDLGL